MAENSNIEWTLHTMNPWVGCSKVSAGCKNCYAETLMDQRYGRVKWGPNGTRSRTADSNWRQPLRWNKKAEQAGERHRVFCASLADVFEDRPELVQWREDLFRLIMATPHLDWLLLTKRPENILRMWPEEEDDDDIGPMALSPSAYGKQLRRFANVWLGTSVEDQEAADQRIPELLKATHLCRYTFLSCEPLLGPVDLTSIPDGHPTLGNGYTYSALTGKYNWDDGDTLSPPPWLRAIGWIIVGGESGPGKRQFDPDWARSLRDQCAASGVAFFMKQMDKVASIPDDLMIRQFPNEGPARCGAMKP